MLQIQSDRFGFNWRQATSSSYPRFENNIKKFKTEFEQFAAFCEDYELGVPQSEFCEVVYVNHIPLNENENFGELFTRVFDGVKFDEPSFTPEMISLRRTYVIGDQKGRLYAEAEIPSPQSNKIIFKLTSRVRCSNNLYLAALQEAHDFLIECFLKLTREEYQIHHWERNDEH